jgi:hypothetical protein
MTPAQLDRYCERLLQRMSVQAVVDFMNDNMITQAPITYERVERVRVDALVRGATTAFKRRSGAFWATIDVAGAQQGSRDLLKAVARYHSKYAPSLEARRNWEKVAHAS